MQSLDQELFRDKWRCRVHLLMTLAVMPYVVYETYDLVSQGMHSYFIKDRSQLDHGYRQLEKLSILTARLNLLVYFVETPASFVYYSMKVYQSYHQPSQEKLIDNSFSYTSLVESDPGTISSTDDDSLNASSSNEGISEHVKRFHDNKRVVSDSLASCQMIALMISFCVTAPIYLYQFNDSDDFYPVNYTGKRDSDFQLYRIFSLYRTLSSYNLAYPTALSWYTLLITKLLTDVPACLMKLRYDDTMLMSMLKRSDKLEKSYKQAFAIMILSILPLTIMLLGLTNRNGSEISYLKMLSDMEFRSENGVSHQICKWEKAIYNMTLPSYQLMMEHIDNGTITIDVTRPAEVMNYHCFPSWALSEMINGIPWAFNLLYQNAPIARCHGDQFPTNEVGNFSMILPAYEIFLLYPAATVLFFIILGGQTLSSFDDKSCSVLFKHGVFQKTFDDTVEFFYTKQIGVLVSAVITFGLLSQNYQLDETLSGVKALFGNKSDESRDVFGQIILLFINAWSCSLLFASGHAWGSYVEAIKKERTPIVISDEQQMAHRV